MTLTYTLTTPAGASVTIVSAAKAFTTATSTYQTLKTSHQDAANPTTSGLGYHRRHRDSGTREGELHRMHDRHGGTYALTATDGSLTSATSSSVTINAASAAKLAFTTAPSPTATSGTALATQPVVTVQDAAGNTTTTTTSSVTLTLTTPAGASLTCAANPTAATSGIASFTGCTIDTAGTYTLTATDGSLTSATSSSVTINAASAAKLAFTTAPSPTSTSGTALATQPVVTVQDAAGNTTTKPVR